TSAAPGAGDRAVTGRRPDGRRPGWSRGRPGHAGPGARPTAARGTRTGGPPSLPGVEPPRGCRCPGHPAGHRQVAAESDPGCAPGGRVGAPGTQGRDGAAVLMIPIDRFERRLQDSLADLAGAQVPPYVTDLLARTARQRQRPAWTFPERWLPM